MKEIIKIKDLRVSKFKIKIVLSLIVFIIFFAKLTFAKEAGEKIYFKNIGLIGSFPQLNFDSTSAESSTTGTSLQQESIIAPFVLQTDKIVNYTADLMPQNSTPSWYERNEGGTAYITNGLLYLSTYLDYGAARAYYRYWSSNNTTGWTVEAKLRVIGTYHRTNTDAPYQGLVIEMFDDVKNVALEFYANKIELFNWATNRFPPPPSIASYYLDTTTFHTYRITGKGNDVYVYVDGNLVIDGTGKLTQATFGQYIAFGDDNNGPESGTAYWDYVYYNTTGAYEPGATALTLTPADLVIFAASTEKLTATLSGNNISGRTINFVSSNPSIATIPPSAVTDVNGVAEVDVTGVSVGTATITATEQESGVSDTTTVNVVSELIYDVSATPLTFDPSGDNENNSIYYPLYLNYSLAKESYIEIKIFDSQEILRMNFSKTLKTKNEGYSQEWKGICRYENKLYFNIAEQGEYKAVIYAYDKNDPTKLLEQKEIIFSVEYHLGKDKGVEKY